MKRQMHSAIFLLVLFTAATVMAGSFSRGNLTVSVSASSVCGEITLIGSCNQNCYQETVPHIFDNVATIVGHAIQLPISN